VTNRQEYLIRFLRGCATAADTGQLGVHLGRLMVNGDLMREAADEFEKLLPEEQLTMSPVEELHFHLILAENHSQQALDLLYNLGGPKRSIWFRMALGRAQSILMSLYVRDIRIKG
jgi:hypothetical protein